MKPRAPCSSGAVSIAGGIGAIGDWHERYADEVPRRVVAGHSREDLLDAYAARAAAAAPEPAVVSAEDVLREVHTTYKKLDDDQGIEILLKFELGDKST